MAVTEAAGIAAPMQALVEKPIAVVNQQEYFDGIRSAAEKAQRALKERAEKAMVLMKDSGSKTMTLVKDPKFQTMTIVTAGGAMTLGAVGGAFGLFTGVCVGSAAGLVPALFTFGLSIPAGAVVGGTLGVSAGAAAGGSAGALAGFNSYKYRVQIKDGLVFVQVKATDHAKSAKKNALEAIECGRSKVCCTLETTKAKADKAVEYARDKAHEVAELATNTRSGITCTSALAGAVLGSVGGGTAGVVAGTVVGLIPAFFTFGLSIPVAAVSGLCIGAVTGGTTCAVGGGAAGYAGFTYREEIHCGACTAWTKAHSSADYVKNKAKDSAVHVSEHMRYFVGGTGGTH